MALTTPIIPTPITALIGLTSPSLSQRLSGFSASGHRDVSPKREDQFLSPAFNPGLESPTYTWNCLKRIPNGKGKFFLVFHTLRLKNRQVDFQKRDPKSGGKTDFKYVLLNCMVQSSNVHLWFTRNNKGDKGKGRRGHWHSGFPLLFPVLIKQKPPRNKKVHNPRK